MYNRKIWGRRNKNQKADWGCCNWSHSNREREDRDPLIRHSKCTAHIAGKNRAFSFSDWIQKTPNPVALRAWESTILALNQSTPEREEQKQRTGSLILREIEGEMRGRCVQCGTYSGWGDAIGDWEEKEEQN